MAALVRRSTLHPRAVTMIVQNLLIKFCFGNLVLRPIIIMRMMMIVIGKSSYLVVKWVKWWLLELSSDEDEEGWGWGLKLGWKWELGNGRPLQQSGWHVRAEDNVAATSISNPTAIFSWWLLLAPSGALIAIPTYYWPSTHPTFSDLAFLPLYNNIGLSLSEPLQLYQKQSLASSAGYMYT